MFLVMLVEPTATLPNTTVSGAKPTGTEPQPESDANTGPLGAVSSTVIWPPEVAPVAVGAKSTPITQLEFPFTLPVTAPPLMGQVVVAASSTNGPPKMTELMVRFPACRFL